MTTLQPAPTALGSGNLRRMAQYCRRLADNRSSTEARRALLRMAMMYEARARDESARA